MRKGLMLLQTDRELLYYLHANKIARVAQLRRDLKGFHCKQTAYKRFARLRKEGLIEIRGGIDERRLMLLNISDKGFNTYVNCGDALRCELKSKSPAHDLDLVDIRNRISRSQRTAIYFTENELQTWGHLKQKAEIKPFIDIRCDGLVGFQTQDEVVYLALEYEASRKADSRYRDLFLKYYAESEIGGVLYICKSEFMLRMLRERERAAYGKYTPKFFYTTFENLMTREELVFEAFNGSKIRFGPLKASVDSVETSQPMQKLTSDITY